MRMGTGKEVLLLLLGSGYLRHLRLCFNVKMTTITTCMRGVYTCEKASSHDPAYIVQRRRICIEQNAMLIVHIKKVIHFLVN